MPGYISEVDYDGDASSNFIEIVLPRGTDPSGYSITIYDSDGMVVETFTLGPVVGSFGSNDVYVIDSNTPNFPDVKNSDAIALVNDTGGVEQFIAFKDPVTATEGPADGMSATQVGEHSGSNQSIESNDQGASYAATPTASKGSVPCYAPGTLIDTVTGPRAVESLGAGDLVHTLDNGPQPIRWARSTECPLEEADVDEKPVLIQAGALGKGLPTQDLIVSPQHRILVGSGGQLLSYFDSEAFVPAKALARLPGIRQMKGKSRITWIHFACDRHEIVTANGCLSESLLLGQMVFNGLTHTERRALRGLFHASHPPYVALNGGPARPCMSVGEAWQEIANRAKLISRELRGWNVGAALEQYEVNRLFEVTASRDDDLRLAG